MTEKVFYPAITSLVAQGFIGDGTNLFAQSTRSDIQVFSTVGAFTWTKPSSGGIVV